jgi:hypothetical protein
MKWSEFKKLVDAEVSRNSGLSIHNPFDPEIEYIDIGAGWITLDDLHIYFEDGKLSISN